MFRVFERILVISKLTVLENSRKQVFHVLLIAALAIICASTLLSFFTLGVQLKILKDLSLTSIIFCGGMLAVALASAGLPGEIEHRTLYPILARPIRRWEFIFGKYLGTLATIYSGLIVIAFAFGIILVRYGGSISNRSLDARNRSEKTRRSFTVFKRGNNQQSQFSGIV